jgi:hypothetical protein
MKHFLIVLIFLLLADCSSVKEIRSVQPGDLATAWAEMTLHITKTTPANSPTFASRALGYIGVTMYESVVHGFPNYNSLAGQLNGLGELPLPEKGKEYDWNVALNAGQAAILKSIYLQTSDENKNRIDSLETFFLTAFSESTDRETLERSTKFGRTIAATIFEWSKTDGGHRGYLKNFDKTFSGKPAPGSWEPPLYGQSFSHFPLHPHWGKNRTFVKTNSGMDLTPMISYNNEKKSDYYNQFQKVLTKSATLTQEEKEAALWWGDDPGETFTPPGHSYYLATLVLKKSKPDLIKSAETYARVGIAVADAFTNCWKWKYHFYSERPSSYISKNMDARWESFWPDPPFPAFPSGHATQAGAVAEVLAVLYGEKFEFTDDAHVGRRKDELRQVEFKARSFSSFTQVAEEIANSRFYGGIHTPQDNEIGLSAGRAMGNNVNSLQWMKVQPYAATTN